MDTENTTPKKPRKPGSGGARANAGGKRPGAGRKTYNPDGTVRTSYGKPRLPKRYNFHPDIIEKLSKIENETAFIEAAIQEKLERDFLRDISQ